MARITDFDTWADRFKAHTEALRQMLDVADHHVWRHAMHGDTDPSDVLDALRDAVECLRDLADEISTD